ncbi:hypothetical protein [Zooshikella ganghwensis]|uniref:hypothetical protein n=1 Tax=Zooshikella ganghwensis TaxID=202772 RepID=UPI000481165D|nr:hypothetical protein [Zooshikella ganghwensis]
MKKEDASFPKFCYLEVYEQTNRNISIQNDAHDYTTNVVRNGLPAFLILFLVVPIPDQSVLTGVGKIAAFY